MQSPRIIVQRMDINIIDPAKKSNIIYQIEKKKQLFIHRVQFIYR